MHYVPLELQVDYSQPAQNDSKQKQTYIEFFYVVNE